MSSVVKVVGVGPGDGKYLCEKAREALINSSVLVGGKRLLQTFASSEQRVFSLEEGLEAAVDFICREKHSGEVAVLVSGDPGIFSFAAYLRQYLNREEIEIIPGISAFQLLFARLCISWQEASFFSVHGKFPAYLVEAVLEEKISVIFTDSKWTPSALAQHLMEKGVPDLKAAVGKDLSYPEEEVYRTTLAELAATQRKENNSLLVIFND